MDENYISYPGVFYFPMPSKIKAGGSHLKSENVSFDVTCCADSSAPDGLPLVFLTGFKVTYQAAAPAVPRSAPETKNWSQWFHKIFSIDENKAFMAVSYKGNSVRALIADQDGTIHNFIPADFDPKGKTYKQLTP